MNTVMAVEAPVVDTRQAAFVRDTLKDPYRVKESVESAFEKFRPWEQFQLLERVALSITHAHGVEAKLRLEMFQYMLEHLSLNGGNAQVVCNLLRTSVRYLMQSNAGEWRDFPFIISITVIDELERR